MRAIAARALPLSAATARRLHGVTRAADHRLWGWAVDRVAPHKYDVIGARICVLGVAVIMYPPRSN